VQLRAGLRLFRGIIQRRNTIPVLGTVRFSDGRLTGTDLDMELSVALPTIGKMEGEAAVDWFGLGTLAGCLDPDEEVTVSEDGGLAAVTFNGSDYRMASCAVSDFPDFGAVEGPLTTTGNLGLVAAMRRIHFAVSFEETRYYLNGIALLAGPDGAVLAATDGHRLALMPLAAMPEGATGAIIPKHAAHWLCSVKREPEACVFAGVEPGSGTARPRARFEFAGMTLSAKLIDGTFPDIFQVIPRDPQPAFSIDRVRLLRVLMRMREFGAGRNRGVKLKGAEGVMTLSLVYASEGRSATETLALDGGGIRVVRGRFQCRLPDIGAVRAGRRPRDVCARARRPRLVALPDHQRRRQLAHRPDADAGVRAA
jgi:DNA polymerase-3 subunit beta